MEKIIITIPDNLTPQQEALAISEQLGKKYLPSSSLKLIGSGYEVKHLETQIVIRREAVEKPVVTCECSVCSTVFEKSLGKDLWVNYGGIDKKRKYCSDICRNTVIAICGDGRASIKRKELKRVVAYW